MTEEEYFRKTYPDFCYGDRPLSPYWDLFQYGVEFGERQSEKKIEELEKENTELKRRLDNLFNSDCWASDQLTKAKDFLKMMYYLYYDPCVTDKDLENRGKLFKEVIQFIKEIEK